MLCLHVNHARVGSSRLNQIMREIGFQAINEPFHPNSAGKNLKDYKDDIKKHSQLNDNDLNSKNYNSTLTIKETLKAFSKSPKPYFSGVVNHHFHGRKILLAQLCSMYPLLILQRNLLDSYISQLKAEMTLKWTKVDTTSINPTLSAIHFKAYCVKIINYYNLCFYSAKSYHNNIYILNYEDWSALSNPLQVNSISKYFREKDIAFADEKGEFIKYSSINHRMIKPQNFSDKSQRKPQDKTKDREKKFANYLNFYSECCELGISNLINLRPINQLIN